MKSVFSVLLAMSAKKRPVFVARKGNVGVPVYTNKPGCHNQQQVVCYYEVGKRKRRAFSNLEKAKAKAYSFTQVVGDAQTRPGAGPGEGTENSGSERDQCPMV